MSTPMRKLMDAYCNRLNLEPRDVRFEYRSLRRASPRSRQHDEFATRVLRRQDTALLLGMEDGDGVNARIIR
jgi:hypothetical protein